MDIGLQHQFCLAYVVIFLRYASLPDAYADLTDRLLTGKKHNEYE
jgi:hypothetical protein